MKMFTPVLVAIAFAITSHAWTTTQDAADRLGAAQVKEVSFDKNSDKLTDAQKAYIRAAI